MFNATELGFPDEFAKDWAIWWYTLQPEEPKAVSSDSLPIPYRLVLAKLA